MGSHKNNLLEFIWKSTKATKKAYDEIKDAAFYKAETWHTYYLGKGFFVVFDKDDLHRPCVKITETKKVKKYVFKIGKV